MSAGTTANSHTAVATRTDLASVLSDLGRHPVRLLERWNWKSALVSALIRSAIFFSTNLSRGRSAAWAAFTTEIVLRLATSGFYGGLTQELGRVEPAWTAMVAAMVALPLLSHGLEFAVHAWRGTPALLVSISASAAFTVLSTAFNVFAMRRGALITGPGAEPLLLDLRRMPRLLAAFLASPAIAVWQAVRRLGR